jgi:haloalkane dehalogenase
MPLVALVAPVARRVAPDLIGFGQSGKPDIDYSFFDQARYLDPFLEAAGITSAYLVLQDWGTGLGFHLAVRRPDFVKGIAFMEFLRPFKDWEDFSETPEIRAAFTGFRTPGVGEEMILDQNMFVEHGSQTPRWRKPDSNSRSRREPNARREGARSHRRLARGYELNTGASWSFRFGDTRQTLS